MATIRAEELTAEHFGKTLHFEDVFFGKHYVFHGELTSIANELPYFWTRHSAKPYKIYKGDNREVPEYYDCGDEDCVLYMEHEIPGPVVTIELDDDEMLELDPNDELEIIDA